MKVFGVLTLGFREANAKYLRGFVSALTNLPNLYKSCRKENEKRYTVLERAIQLSAKVRKKIFNSV